MATRVSIPTHVKANETPGWDRLEVWLDGKKMDYVNEAFAGANGVVLRWAQWGVDDELEELRGNVVIKEVAP